MLYYAAKGPKPPKRIALGWSTLIHFLGLLVILCSGLPFLGKQFWLFNELGNFRLQYVATSAVLLTMCIFNTIKFSTMIVYISCLLVNGYFIFPYFDSKNNAIEENVNLHVMSLNVGNKNNHCENIYNLITNHEPDLVLLQEVDKITLANFSALKNRYPYQIKAPRADKYGLALFSRIPFKNKGVIHYGEQKLPLLKCVVTIAKKRVTIIGTQLTAPVDKTSAEHRNQQLKRIASYARKTKEALIVMGNLNITPWHGTFKKQLAAGHLSDSMKPYGFHGTWPAWLPEVLALPIDHLLHNNKVIIADRTTFPVKGSYHRGIEVMAIVK